MRRSPASMRCYRPGELDILVLAILIVAFATMCTAHVYLLGVLLIKVRPRWRGLLALLIPPLAPLWGFKAGRRWAALIWLVALFAYTIALVLASSHG